MAYFRIHARVPRVRVGQVHQVELQGVRRFLKYPELAGILRDLIALPLNIQNVPMQLKPNEIFPLKNNTLVNISTLTSKQFRLNRINSDEQLICVYKIGLILNPGEVMSWTGQMKKLTSTRHKNIILRVAHGDIFSNSRLTRFGLRQDSSCLNCAAPSESVQHRLFECNSAVEAWRELERAKITLNLKTPTDLSLENLMGAKDRVGKIELALQAELMHRLASGGAVYNPRELIKRVVKYIGYSERLSPDLKTRFNEYQTSQ